MEIFQGPETLGANPTALMYVVMCVGVWGMYCTVGTVGEERLSVSWC